METRIKKRVQGEILEKLFDENSFIRYTKVLNIVDEEYNNENEYLFEINIRHNENENPKELFNNAFKKLTA